MNGKERVLHFLESNQGKKFIVPNISDAVNLADNTTVKWLCAWRNLGKPVFSEPIPGKTYYQWWYSEAPIKPVKARKRKSCPKCGADWEMYSVEKKCIACEEKS